VNRWSGKNRVASLLSSCYSAEVMASKSVNKVILLGRLGKDAETKFTAGGAAVTKFSIATSFNRKDPQSGEWKEETNWTNVTLWKGENVSPYLLKGTQVYLEGRLQTRSYDDKDGKKTWATDVVVDARDVVLLGSSQGRGGESHPDPGEYSPGPVSMPRSARPAAAQPAAPQAHDDFGQGVTEDDVPF
jgi:single-strand DNA-binding protein